MNKRNANRSTDNTPGQNAGSYWEDLPIRDLYFALYDKPVFMMDNYITYSNEYVWW